MGSGPSRVPGVYDSSPRKAYVGYCFERALLMRFSTALSVSVTRSEAGWLGVSGANAVERAEG